jgi:hypothetical protein
MKRFLKFFLFTAVMIAATHICLGQLVERKAKDSSVNGQTRNIVWRSTADGIVGFQLTAVKVSGTVSAYAILERRIDYVVDSAAYDRASADTFFITNVSTTQLKVWPIDTQAGNGYRIRVVSTGTQKVYLYAAFLRRSRR